MGYTMDFVGVFFLDRELDAEHAQQLRDFANERHDDTKFPDFYCHWRPTKDLAGIEWDGGEKFYEYVAWLELIIERFLIPWGHVLNGTVKWQGEEMDDRGKITVEDNRVTTELLE